MAEGLCVAVVGASGALGSEVLFALDGARLPIRKLVPIATDRSLGVELEFQGVGCPIETDRDALEGVDVVFVCTPPRVALDWIAEAVVREVLVIDLSGAIRGSSALAQRPELEQMLVSPEAPLIAPAPGLALAWLRVLAPLREAFGIQRVVATAFLSASGSGRAGVDALYEETVALLGLRNTAEEDAPALDHPIALDVVPWAGELESEGACAAEREVEVSLRRVLVDALQISVTVTRVPTFCGDGASLAIECSGPVTSVQVRETLRKALDVELVEDPHGPTTRSAAGAERVLVGRIRRDPVREDVVLLWLAADTARLAAVDAVRTAIGRLGLP